MNLPETSNNELIVFRSKDGSDDFQVILDGKHDTVWTTEQQIMSLLGKARRTHQKYLW